MNKLYAARHEKIPNLRAQREAKLMRTDAATELVLPWVTAEVAATWPEGSAVLSRPAGAPLSAKKAGHRMAELHQWFRPDFVGIVKGYGADPREYLLLEQP